MAAIAVYCSASTQIAPAYVRLAAQVGAEIARRRHSLVTGGGDISCMGAVARSARAGGAHTLGVIPRALLQTERGDQDADELVVVDDMRTRKGLMDGRADAFLMLPGGLGTLEELLEVWVAALLGFHAKPLVALDADGLYAPLRHQVELLVEQGFVRRHATALLHWAATVEEALDVLEAGLDARPTEPTVREALESTPASPDRVALRRRVRA